MGGERTSTGGREANATTLGLPSGTVALAEDHAAWRAAFDQERTRLLAALGDTVLRVEHVGSTAIPGVPAKPILDILIGVHDFEGARVCVDPMITLGYEYRGEYGIPRRHYFVRGEPRTHHVHMVEIDSDNWRITLGFRDLLRGDPGLAGEYALAKEQLVRAHANDRDAYQRGKDVVVERLLTRLPGARGAASPG